MLKDDEEVVAVEAIAEETAPLPKLKRERKKKAAAEDGGEEATTPKKAKRKVKAKAKGKAKAKPIVANGLLGEVVGNRVNTKKAQLFQILMKNEKKQMSKSKLITDIYGKDTAENSMRFNMVMGGIIQTIKDKKLKWEVRKSRDEKELSFGLFPVK